MCREHLRGVIYQEHRNHRRSVELEEVKSLYVVVRVEERLIGLLNVNPSDPAFKESSVCCEPGTVLVARILCTRIDHTNMDSRPVVDHPRRLVAAGLNRCRVRSMCRAAIA